MWVCLVGAGLTITDLHLVERDEASADSHNRPRFTGEAYVKFADGDQAARAHEFHMAMLGHRYCHRSGGGGHTSVPFMLTMLMDVDGVRRYVEVFQSSEREFEYAADPSKRPPDDDSGQQRLHYPGKVLPDIDPQPLFRKLPRT